jgi:hypothetical protein
LKQLHDDTAKVLIWDRQKEEREVRKWTQRKNTQDE